MPARRLAVAALLTAALAGSAAAQPSSRPAIDMLRRADALLEERELDSARMLYLRAERLCRRALDTVCETRAQRGLGYVALSAGDTGVAAQAFGRGLERAAEAEDAVAEAKAVIGLADIAMAQRGPYRAGLLYQRALEAFRGAGDRAGEDMASRGLDAAAALAARLEQLDAR